MVFTCLLNLKGSVNNMAIALEKRIENVMEQIKKSEEVIIN